MLKQSIFLIYHTYGSSSQSSPFHNQPSQKFGSLHAALQQHHCTSPRFSGHCWRSKNEVVSYLVLRELKHGKRIIGRQDRTFVDLLEADTGVPRNCSTATMDDRVCCKKKDMGLGWGGGSTEVNLVAVAAAVVVAVIVVSDNEGLKLEPTISK